MKFIYLNILLTFVWTISAIAQEDQQCLNLEKAIQIALDQNPSNRAAEYGIQIAQESVGIAKSYYYPTLDAYAFYKRFKSYIFLPKFPQFPGINFTIPHIVGPVNDYALGVRSRYLIYDSGKRNAQLEAAKAQEGVSEYEADRVSQKIILDVSVGFYTVLADQQLEIVAKKQLERASNHLKMVKERKEAGDVPLVDVYTSEVQVASAEHDIIRSQAEIKVDTGNLNITMGLPPDTNTCLCHDMGPIFEPKDDLLCEAFKQAEENRPEMQSALQKIVYYQSLVKEAKARFGPELVAEGLYGRQDQNFFPHYEEWSIGVRADWNLFDGFGSEHNLRRACFQLAQSEQEFDHTKLQVQQDVWASFSRLKEAYNSLDTLQKQVKSATESLRLYEKRFEVGAATLTELLDAQTALTKSEGDFVVAQWNYFISLASFKWSQGL